MCLSHQSFPASPSHLCICCKHHPFPSANRRCRHCILPLNLCTISSSNDSKGSSFSLHRAVGQNHHHLDLNNPVIFSLLFLIMPSLLDLPLEIVEQIISVFTKEESPSAKFIYQQPSKALLSRSYHPLKDLSCACQGLRRLCFSSLFSALKVNLEVVTGFLDFIKSSKLAGRVDSLALFTTPEYLGGRLLWPQMVEIIDSINAPSITTIFPPFVFAEILPYGINLRDAWAFRIEYQVLRLEMPRSLVPPKTPKNVFQNSNIFAMRPWSHCIYNEGSSVEAYSTYEYSLKDKPSVFCPSSRSQFVRTMRGSLDHLTSIDIIAVFPITNWGSFLQSTSGMKSLRRLRTQLTPTSGNDVLDNPSALGKCHRGDLWME